MVIYEVLFVFTALIFTIISVCHKIFSNDKKTAQP